MLCKSWGPGWARGSIPGVIDSLSHGAASSYLKAALSEALETVVTTDAVPASWFTGLIFVHCHI